MQVKGWLRRVIGTPPPRQPTSRQDMDAALQAILVPHLRSMGFKGSRPHFRRLRGNAADLLTLQFFSAGGMLVVEIGRVAAKGFDSYGRFVALEKANTSYLQYRHRLGAPLTGGDHWFDFSNSDPEEVVRQIIAALEQPEPWALIDSWPVLGLP